LLILNVFCSARFRELNEKNYATNAVCVSFLIHSYNNNYYNMSLVMN